MKLNTMFVRYLLREGYGGGLPREAKRAFKAFGVLMDDYVGGTGELRDLGAILIVNSEPEGDDVATLTADVLAVLKNYHNDFVSTSWSINGAFAGAIHKLQCEKQAFRVMAQVAGKEEPQEKFGGLLTEFKNLGATLPTDEEWTALKPQKKEGKGKKKGK